MPPDRFIPLAEQTGQIGRVTDWLLRTAAALAARWRDQQIGLAISINLSARDLSDTALPRTVRQVLADNGVPHDRIALELTESAILHNPDLALSVLGELHDMGLHIAVDDYGTGYSSLSYLKRLPCDQIKIDRSFVMDLTSSADDRVLVKSTIELGHNIGLRVTAEGVEDAESVAILRDMGCDLVQGYHFAKPQKAADLESLLSTVPWAPPAPAPACTDGCAARSIAGVP